MFISGPSEHRTLKHPQHPPPSDPSQRNWTPTHGIPRHTPTADADHERVLALHPPATAERQQSLHGEHAAARRQHGAAAAAAASGADGAAALEFLAAAAAAAAAGAPAARGRRSAAAAVGVQRVAGRFGRDAAQAGGDAARPATSGTDGSA